MIFYRKLGSKLNFISLSKLFAAKAAKASNPHRGHDLSQITQFFLCFLVLSNSAAYAVDPAPAAATPQVVNCEAVLQDRRDTKGERTDVEQCITRGADPIAAVRPNGGKSAGVKGGIANGFSLGTMNAPENSPHAVKANASVSSSAIKSTCQFPPRIGVSFSISNGIKISGNAGSCLNFSLGLFKDKNGQSAAGTAPPGTTPGVTTGTNPVGTTTSASCAPDSDTAGTYGAKVAVASGSNALVCGGAIPLSNYQLTLSPNPTALASTEAGAYYIWFYQKQGAGYKLMGSNPLKLPTHLGTWDQESQTCNNKIDLGAPIAQMVTYSANSQTISLRLIRKEPAANAANPNPTPADALDYDANNIERFLVIPIENGVPKVPTDCSPVDDYYKPITTAIADMVIDASPGLTCESSADQCALGSTTTGPAASCDLVNIFPSGTTQTSAGAVNCNGTTLYSVLNRPNLIFKPGSTPVATSIEGRTAQLVGTTEGSKLYAPTDTVLHLGTRAIKFVLNDGGTLGMTDNSRLRMSGPATINPANASIVLTNGGQLLGPTGAIIKEISAGTNYTPPNPIFPLTILVGRSMDMPAGYQIPTQPSPYVRLPLDKQ